MNGNTVRAYCTQPLRFLAVISAALLLLAACDNPPVENHAPVVSAMAMPAGMDVVYGPVNNANPFEHVGLRHNDLVHATIASAEPWDTLNVAAMFSHIRKSVPVWSAANMEIPGDRCIGHVSTAFAMEIDSSAPQRLASFTAPGCTAREIDYIRRIGRMFCEAVTFSALEEGLLDLEKRILAEQWPDGNTTETHARIAISVAKHSFSYWKRMFCTVAGVDPLEVSSFRLRGSGAGSLSKPAEPLIKILTKAQTVTAADVLAATSAAEAAAALGPLRQIEAAIVTGGAVSLVVAALVYFDDIVIFFRTLAGCGSNN